MEVDELFDVRGDDTVELRVHAQPGAGRTAVVGTHGTALKVRVAAPPVGGRANEACRSLLAETFGLDTGQVELAGDETSRMKRFRLSGLGDVEDFRRHLERALEEAQSRPGKQARQAGLR